MSNNAGKYFLGGFQPNFARSFDTSYRGGQENKRKEYDLAQQKIEDDRKAAEQKIEEDRKATEKQKSSETVNRLLQNGRQLQTLRGGLPYFAADDEQTQMELASTLSASELNRYQDLKKMFEKKPLKYVYKEDSPKAFIEGPDGRYTLTEEPNPMYKKKEKNRLTGDINGKKVTRITYEDNSYEDIPSPFSSDDKREKRKAIDNNLKTINNIKKLKELYLESEGDETARRYVNSLTNDTREKVYLQFNDKQKEFIDKQYNSLKNDYKKNGFNTLEEFEAAGQDEIFKSISESIYDAVDNNTIEWEDAQGMLNYYELKYGYLK